MICPVCNAECPPRTVFCSHCHTTLVEGLAEADQIVEKAYPGSALVHLWRGEDAALHASLLQALTEAGIPLHEQAMGSGPSARPIDRLLDHVHPRFGFEVAVLSSHLAQAEVILEKLLNEGVADMSLPVKNAAEETLPKPRPLGSSIPTVELWSGEDKSLAGFLEAALRENGLAIRVDRHGLSQEIYVVPADQSRAREIVREIIEGAPPE